jgi:hypothetical protein
VIVVMTAIAERGWIQTTEESGVAYTTPEKGHPESPSHHPDTFSSDRGRYAIRAPARQWPSFDYSTIPSIDGKSNRKSENPIIPVALIRAAISE